MIRPGDFLLERRIKSASLTPAGMVRAFDFLGKLKNAYPVSIVLTATSSKQHDLHPLQGAGSKLLMIKPLGSWSEAGMKLVGSWKLVGALNNSM